MARLISGGKFPLYNMQTRVESELELQPSNRASFADVSELPHVIQAAAQPATLVPRNRNFTAVDAVLANKALANVTIDLSHKLLLYGKKGTEGVVPVADALGKTKGELQFYWVMPPQRYTAAKEKKGTFPIYAGGPAQVDMAEALLTKHGGRIRQFLVCVDIPLTERAMPETASEADDADDDADDDS